MRTIVNTAREFGPFLDGRTVRSFSFEGLPTWAAESLLVTGEPGAGQYMTLPKAAAADHPWLDETQRQHPLVQRYGA